jgi:hypothetical protein
MENHRCNKPLCNPSLGDFSTTTLPIAAASCPKSSLKPISNAVGPPISGGGGIGVVENQASWNVTVRGLSI